MDGGIQFLIALGEIFPGVKYSMPPRYLKKRFVHSILSIFGSFSQLNPHISKCTKILRIFTHPYINMYREYYNGTLYSKASTKIRVISHLISDSLEREGKILIVTEYNAYADIVECICDEASIRQIPLKTRCLTQKSSFATRASQDFLLISISFHSYATM